MPGLDGNDQEEDQLMSSKLPDRVDDSLVVAVMSEALGAPVVNFQPLIGAVGGQNARLDTADGSVYTLKIADRAILATEIWACNWANDHGIPAPKVVTGDLVGRALGRGYLVLRWRDGTEPGSQDDAIREAGCQVARLHATSIPGFGRVTTASGVARGEFATWNAYLGSINDKRADLGEHLILDPATARASGQVLRSVGQDITYTQPGSVLHSDLHVRHFLADHGHLRGILDWADASVGDPVMDLAVLSRDGDEALANFMLGYGLEMSPGLQRKILAYRLLSTIDTLWFEWRTGGDWFDTYRRRIAADSALLASTA